MDLTQSSRNQFKAAADPCRGARDVHPFFRSNFFQFHAVFGENGQNNRFPSTSFEVGSSPAKSWIRTARYIVTFSI